MTTASFSPGEAAANKTREVVPIAYTQSSTVEISRSGAASSVGDLLPLTSLPVMALIPGWSLRRPLTVFFTQDADETYIVSDEEFLVYGAGATIPEAWRDYAVSLVEYFELVERQAAQSDAARPLLQRLQEYVVRDRNQG